MQTIEVKPEVLSTLSTMEDWAAFEECMDLGSLNCEEAEECDGIWSCRGLHEDPENLPYDEEFPYFDRTIYVHWIYFLKEADHLQFQDGRILLLPANEDGLRELRREDAPDEPTYLYWAERNGKCFIQEEGY